MYSLHQKLLRQGQITDGPGQFWVGLGQFGGCLDPVPVPIGALVCHLLGALVAHCQRPCSLGTTRRPRLAPSSLAPFAQPVLSASRSPSTLESRMAQEPLADGRARRLSS